MKISGLRALFLSAGIFCLATIVRANESLTFEGKAYDLNAAAGTSTVFGSLDVIATSAITVTRLVFDVSTSAGDVQGVSHLVLSLTGLTDEHAFVGGPVDIDVDGSVVFTDPFEISAGVSTLTLTGDIGGFPEDTIITVALLPRLVEATASTGDVLDVFPDADHVELGTRKVRVPRLDVTIGSLPVASYVPAGTTNALMLTMDLDTTSSSEDLNIYSVSVSFTSTNLQSLGMERLVDGRQVVAYRDDGNITNPTKVEFELAEPIFLLAGTIRTLSVEAWVNATTPIGTVIQCGIASVSAVGVLTGQSAAIHQDTSYAPPQTVTAPVGRAIGDFDNSGCTNVADFLILLDNWQTEYEGTTVSTGDFLTLLDNWTNGCS